MAVDGSDLPLHLHTTNTCGVPEGLPPLATACLSIALI